MPELSEIFEQAKGLDNFNDDVARTAAMEALKKAMPGLYQSISNLGFGAAQAKLSKEVTDARAAQQAAEAKLTETTTAHQTQLRDLQDKAPDVKKVNEAWEMKVDETSKTHTREMRKLRDQLRGVLLERDQGQLQALLEDLGVPKAISGPLSRDPALLPARADYDESNSLTVRQAGQQIPLGPGSGLDHLKLVAHEVASRPEVKAALESRSDSGGGVSGGNQPGTGDKGFYDDLRKKTKEAPLEGMPTKSLRERVGGR